MPTVVELPTVALGDGTPVVRIADVARWAADTSRRRGPKPAAKS